jgi:prepilin-type N-terminal cleavage/methylation domain-containing protein
MLQKLNKPTHGFTLVEIMIVVAIIALLAAIAVPNFLRARKRSQATRILEDLRIIDSAIDQYAIETNRSSGDTVNWSDVQKYLKQSSVLYNSSGKDMFGNAFLGNKGGVLTATGTFYVDGSPNTALHVESYQKLSDVAPSDFWSPFFMY